MSVSPTVGAEPYGNPAKVVRTYAAAASTEEKTPAAVAIVEAPARPVHAMVLTAGPYLPVTGALPLRFSSARRWPAPLPTSQPVPGDVDTPTATVSVSTPSALPSEAPAIPSTQVATAAPMAATPVAGKPMGSSAKGSPEPRTLTADMVLGYLGNLPANEGRGGARFEPAIPRAVTTTAATTASP